MQLCTHGAGRRPAYCLRSVLAVSFALCAMGCAGRDPHVLGDGSASAGGHGGNAAEGNSNTGGAGGVLGYDELEPDSGISAGETEFVNAALPISTEGLRPGRRFREILGLGTKFAQGEPQGDLSIVTDLGARWVRDTVDWNVMEPQAGQYVDFPAPFLERLEYYRAHDIGVVYLLAYDAYTAYPATASNPTAGFDPVAFGNYAVEAAKRLRNAGVRFVLEMWNEPHNMVLRPVLGGAWNGVAPSPWVDHYLNMVREAVARVKAYDSSIQLITDDDMWVLHYWFLEGGLPREVDGFGFHPYVQGYPERAAIDENTDWMAPFIGVDADGSFTSAVRRLREQGLQKLGKTPSMWITEWGWPVEQATSSGAVFTEDTVAAWLPRAFILAEASGAENMCWFSMQDCVDGPMGLTANDGTRRKAYWAFKTLSTTIGDYYYLGQVAGSRSQTSGAQAYLFRRESSAKLVAWSIEPSLAWLKLDGQLRQAKVTDTYGQPVQASIGSNGASYVPLGPAPLYLDFTLQTRAPNLRVVARTGSTPP